jgi:hypothetical protein
MIVATRQTTWVAMAAGVALGVAYTLSPSTALVLPLLVLVARRAGRGLPTREREWLYGLLTVAIGVRLLAIAGLFLSADDARPFATFFGDEEMFKFRSLWLRNIGLDVPISAADYIYAVEETGKSYYLFVLAYFQAIVGAAPYGVHVLNMALYVMAAVLLYRLVRASFGPLSAFAGLCALLWLPSLFIWSISALKEPLYTVLAAAELACALHIVRGRTWVIRVFSVVGVIGIGVVLETLRKGGLVVAGVGTVAGLAAGLIAMRPRLLKPALLGAPFLAAGALAVPRVNEQLMSMLHASANYHVGHVFTLGFSYKTLEPWYYIDPADIQRMPPIDALTYVVRSLVSFVVQPLPWTIASPALLAYMPEYVCWLAIVALVPFGVAAGLRRDPLLTCTLVAHGAVITLMVALTSGNVGTLIRHRGLALPYFIWLSALGACDLLRFVSRRTVAPGRWFAYADR